MSLRNVAASLCLAKVSGQGALVSCETTKTNHQFDKIANGIGDTFRNVDTHYAARLRVAERVILSVAGTTCCAAVTAVRFDFHEFAFAAPLVSTLIIGLNRRSLRLCLVAALGLICTKEDLGATVIAGAAVAWLTWGPRRRQALPLAVVSVCGILVGYGTILGLSHELGIGGTYFGRLGTPSGLGEQLSSLPQRALPVIAFCVATLILGLRSPLILLALPTFGWRAIASTPAYSQLTWHYDVPVWPVIIACMAMSLSRWSAAPRRGRLVFGAALAVSLVFNAWTMRGISPQAIAAPDPVIASVRAITARVPVGSSITAQDSLVPYLADLKNVSVLDVRSNQAAQYVLLLDSYAGDASQLRAPLCSRLHFLERARAHGYDMWSDGSLVLVELPVVETPPLVRC